ncbi:hypothetical protein LE181_26250 [Streptomyces sp. SCA3-4]|uniref:DUF6875 domain-containing protein n=1 Tax=Streptomyces sichuanensis TaxID=2871810 RepID=UPI001CE292E3|nr:hypothetical protein [Streptomyces sichuanensis]MCA6095649.1 hypothetical protein [Streptomyces sichuanensis]
MPFPSTGIPVNASRVLDDPTAPAWAAETARWARDELGTPVPALGRPGTLCPYMPRALREERVELTECGLPGVCATDLVTHLRRSAREFAEEAGRLAPAQALLSCRIVVYTALAVPDRVLTEVRRRVKPHLLAQGLTTGEFFPENNDRSVRNPTVPIARSPWPALVLRHSTPHDRIFLADQPDLYRVFREAGPGITATAA